MKRKIAAATLSLAMIAASSDAMGAARCARPDEVTAVQTTMIQQELMVAALTCNEVARFNAFQTGYAPELRTYDATLERMFKRLYGGRRGEAEYHSFKTRLANHSSIRSIHNNSDYCREASLVFGAALTPDKPSLASFVAGVQVFEDSPVDSCAMRVAVGLAGVKAVPDVVPKPNPERAVSVEQQ